MSDWYSEAREADGRTDEEVMAEIRLRRDALLDAHVPALLLGTGDLGKLDMRCSCGATVFDWERHFVEVLERRR